MYTITFYRNGYLLEVLSGFNNPRQWAATMGYMGNAEVAFIEPR